MAGQTVDGVTYASNYAKNDPVNGIAKDYDITPSGGTVSQGQSNYALRYISGKLTVTVNAAALDVAIAAAKTAKIGVDVSDKSAIEIAKGQKFVKDAVMDALNHAIVAAETAKSSATTADHITTAVAALENAIREFSSAIQIGTLVSGSSEADRDAPIGPQKPNIDKFTDIVGHWAIESIKFVVSEGLFQGTSDVTFSPNMDMNRAMFVTVLGRMANVDMRPHSAPDFADVALDAYYAKYVAWAVEKGITQGTAENAFSPENSISRQELVVMLHRYAKLSGIDVSVGEDTNILSYNDAFDIVQWAIPAFQWACGSGVVQGEGENLYPTATATRAEVATMLQRFAELMQK